MMIAMEEFLTPPDPIDFRYKIIKILVGDCAGKTSNIGHWPNTLLRDQLVDRFC